MAIATVNVIRSFFGPSGWVKEGRTTMDLEDAQAQPHGYLEILSVDGLPYVNPPCCGGARPADAS